MKLSNIKYFLCVFFIMLISISFISCDKPTEPDPVPDPTEPPVYELIWSDEFNQESSTLDASKWNYDIGYGEWGWGNDEWQEYTDSPENIKVENGNMVISTLFDSDNYVAPGKRNGSITSARVNTQGKFSMKYGKIEARIKPPKGAGMWPAFWMLGSNYNYDEYSTWPKCGEIDIMEMSYFYHDDKTTMCTVHWWDDVTESHQYYGTTKTFDYSLADDYHIFAVEWDADRIIGKIDGITYFTKVINPATMSEFRSDFFIIVNNAVGGNLGGAPNETTQWPQHMYVDWIRAYQAEGGGDVVETFGVFTEETPVDDGLTIDSDADIWVWENTLTDGAIAPYEGNAVMTWLTAGAGWFGAGVQARHPVDLSDFAGGNLNFMIKMPADVTFKIGINDNQGNESFVEFPANETAYGLARDGEWGQATIPVEDLKGSVALERLSYVFIIKEENGAECHFAVDDVYYDGGGTPVSSVKFDADSYTTDATTATIAVTDEAAANSEVSVAVDNGTETIGIDLTLDGMGKGTATLNFGTTNDETNTIAIADGDVLTVTYTDANSNIKTDTAIIQEEVVDNGTFAIYTDDPTINPGIVVGEDSEFYVWENTLVMGTIPPYEGENVLTFASAGVGWFGGGIAVNNPLDMSSFSNGNIKFMIKMPADVTFKIGINDNQGNENYVQFPANQTAYGLERNGEWGQATIPVQDIMGSVDLQELNYVFTILEENGAQCEFAIDHIYWEEGEPESSISFDADTYTPDATSATITVIDEGAANSQVSVTVDNGSENIGIDLTLDGDGNGTATVNFGPTDDETNTIAISEGDVLTVTYTDANGNIKTDTADIEGESPPTGKFGMFTDLTPVDDALIIGEDANLWVWENTLTDGTLPPYEGENVIAWQTTGIGWFGGGIESTTSLDLSSFSNGTIKLMIKMPANVTFDIGIKDAQNENWVTFPANQTAYGLERDGEWGQAIIPLSDIQGSVDITQVTYVFMIRETAGTQCDFAIDDIYWDEEGLPPEGSVNFDAGSYQEDAAGATITVTDEGAANSQVSVTVDNGSESIGIDLNLDATGYGTATLNFGLTDDETNTIAIADGDILTVTYTDSQGNIKTDTANITGGSSPGETMGIYSESHTDPMLEYESIINSADWSGNPAVPDEENTDVNPVDGTYVLSVEYGDYGAGWGGAVFNFGDAGQDMSGYANLIINIDTSAMPNFYDMGIKLEDPSTANTQVQLANYTPVISGNWAEYELPLSDFPDPDLTAIRYLGLWNPSDNGGNLLFGTLYFDDIHLSNESDPPPPPDAAGIYSESHVDPMFTYESIINSADWSGNPAVPDEENTDVTPVDGTYVLSVEYGDYGAGWGGAVFNFGDAGQDMSGYSTLVINIDTSAMSNFYDIGIKFEDPSTASTQVQLANYTPTISGNWAKYELPLSDFPDPDFTAIRYLGLWNPADNSGNMIFGTLYFDDIHLTE